MLSPCAPLDYETRLYRGCSASELLSIVGTVGCLWLPMALVIGFSMLDGLHALFLGFALFLGGVLVIVATVAKLFQSIKSGKPDGWHLRMLSCQFHPLFGRNLIYKSGRWSTVREE